jgi:hypothetical protein
LIFDQKPGEGRLALLPLRKKKGRLEWVMRDKKRGYMLTREREAYSWLKVVARTVKGEGDDEMR